VILRKANDRSGRALSALQSNTWSSRSESSTVEELHTRASLGLGTLEAAVMESLWKMGEANVSGVVSSLDRRLAYTTVMTTLSRLYRKGLLVRRMIRRAFFYSPAITPEEWDRKRTSDFVATFPSAQCFISSLVDAIWDCDESLLGVLEDQAQAGRLDPIRQTHAPIMSHWSGRVCSR